MKNILIRHSGHDYKKSSFSPRDSKCVGVCIDSDKVLVINTNTRQEIVEFTKGEWDAFLLGVKNNEFDLGE